VLSNERFQLCEQAAPRVIPQASLLGVVERRPLTAREGAALVDLM
jgi:hypothetical protein